MKKWITSCLGYLKQNPSAVAEGKGDYRTEIQAYRKLLHQGFRPTHAVEVLKGLATQDKISVTSNEGQKIRKGAYYINYSDYNNRTNQISIQLT